MATVSVTEDQIKQVNSFIESLKSGKNKSNYKIGKLGEVAFHNYGMSIGLFENFYGPDLFNSVLKNTNEPDLGFDYIAQSLKNKLVRVFVQVKTVSMAGKGCNLLLPERSYDAKLNYYTGVPQDVFVLVKQLSESTYDILGFIETSEAMLKYSDQNTKLKSPVQGCYCIWKDDLHPIEELSEYIEGMKR